MTGADTGTSPPSSAPHYAHGLGKALKAPDWPEIEETELHAVLARFPQAGTLRTIVWRSPRPFSAAARLETDRVPLFVKRHHQSLRTVQDLEEEHRLIAHLRASGAPVVPILSTVTGETVLSDGPWNYELHGIGAGKDVYQDRQSWTLFLSPGHAHAAGTALARLHHALEGYDAPARAPKPLMANDRLIRSRDPLAAMRQEAAECPALARFLAGRAWEREITDHLLAPYHAEARLALVAAPPLWSHGDWHGSNLLWSSEGPDATVTTVLDFGLSDRTSALFDLATAIERSLIPWLDLEGGEPVCDLDQFDQFLRGYGRVSPLSASMLKALAAVLPVIHLGFALSEVDYFAGLLADDDQAAIAYGPYLLGHADWFGRAEGRRLIAHLHRLSERAEEFPT